ncbi:MAG: response regulator, partial [Deltaproteobacteria bacterium]|nr:response regulator [Deltaproteobacteria bacterium]
ACYEGQRGVELASLPGACARAILAAEGTDEEAWRKGTAVRSEEVLPVADGSERVFELLKLPLFHENGQRKGLVMLGRDVSRHKAMEEALLNSKKLESLTTLAGGIAHDFNNILTAILGNLSLAKIFAESDERMLEWLTRAEAASLKAKSLVQQLLTFARSGSPIRKAIGIAALIRENAGFVLCGSNVRCLFSFPENIWPVVVDEGQVSQAIQNVIVNADQAMPEGGLIDVAARNVKIAAEDGQLPAGKYVCITIQDQGIGIDPKHLGKVFDPYFSTKQKGCGLGLAVSYSIIKNHQGFIAVQSEPGVGTKVTIHLPAAEERLALPTMPADEPEPGGKILLMDDEQMVREVAGDMLANLGYTVTCAVDGAEAVKKYRAAQAAGQPFDAVILDLTVPGGLGARQTIQLLFHLDAEVKGIVASGYSTDPVLDGYREHGFVGVIAKPFDLVELSTVLRRIVTPGSARGG